MEYIFMADNNHRFYENVAESPSFSYGEESHTMLEYIKENKLKIKRINIW